LLWSRWKRVAHRAAEYQSQALLAALYLLVFLPVATLMRPWRDPLGRRPRSSAWTPPPGSTASLRDARRQF
jgi:hypothetical protein